MAIDARPQPNLMGTFRDDVGATMPLPPRDKAEGEFDYRFHLDRSVDLRGSRLPYARNPAFVGRDDILAQLSERLTADNALVLLTGPSGIGKTQTAVEFACRYEAQFPGGVFWLRCGHRDLVPNEVAACGADGRATVPGYDSLSQTDKIKMVISAWHKPVPRLLILDDVEDAETVEEWQPETGGCRVLILTAHEDWAKEFGSKAITLPPLDAASSLKLLAGNDPARPRARSSRAAGDIALPASIRDHTRLGGMSGRVSACSTQQAARGPDHLLKEHRLLW